MVDEEHKFELVPSEPIEFQKGKLFMGKGPHGLVFKGRIVPENIKEMVNERIDKAIEEVGLYQERVISLSQDTIYRLKTFKYNMTGEKTLAIPEGEVKIGFDKEEHVPKSKTFLKV